MQVVYSGGSTPNQSPRQQRKRGYGRPIMPGYMTHVHPHILVQRSREKLTEGDITLRDSIPAMSKWVAGLCLLLNIVLPGCGTLMAGLSVLCCSHVRPKEDSKGHCIWVNAGVALVQFLLTFLFLLGWIWSIMWGVAFLSVSKQYYYRKDEEGKEKDNGLEKVHSKTRNVPKSEHEANNGTSSNFKKPQSHQHNINLPEGPHRHHLDHQLSNTTRASSSRSQACEIVQNVPSTSSDAEINNTSQTYISNSAGCSQNTDFYETQDDPITRQPIIVLKQAPLSSQIDTSDRSLKTTTDGTLMTAKTRHMKILQRKMSSNDLSPFVLTHKQLEAIVIHDLPVRAPDSRQTPEPHCSNYVLPKC